MNLGLAVAFLWLIVANIIAMLPTRDHHWTAAYVLIAVGIPVLGWVTWESGPVWGLVLLVMGASVLRWPLIFVFRWARRKVAGE
ncbi:DUF2484 family protein [Paragemmobacter straminiformis]|uniref:DUF2484 family protein n=1 Tax=Paragemmobacter straminiformis TaxID=2045119 RepID=A0A842ID39_9RHOB|nr:DUF2484 family protein [Gemmobacter straminiformis]MBC2837293.1 DUF2484 family protein [Gemmobacter straminiformis]